MASKIRVAINCQRIASPQKAQCLAVSGASHFSVTGTVICDRSNYRPLFIYCKRSLSSLNSLHSITQKSKTGAKLSSYASILGFNAGYRSFSTAKMSTLETLNFDNLVLKSLPLDPETENHVRQVKGACFSLVNPTPVKNPATVVVSGPALALLDLPLSETSKDDFAQYFSGSKILPGSKTAAHCYCGHQFGNFAGQLGDGAAIYLGEIVNKSGERWELQLKGAGLTPYSRTADGRKVLRSSIREFLCSEAMHHLGIPTTRAGSCITSESLVVRDIFYNGNPIEEKCTIVSRIAPSFIRFGSFQVCKPPDRHTGRDGPSVGRLDVLDKLTNYVVQTFYPEVWDKYKDDKKTMCVEFFREVVSRTARLVARWQCVGWCHGVLNTDNMSIVGVTIDYGPYGFIDRFDPGFVCNNSDNAGRYSYVKQPEMCKWNCEKLADALSQMMHMDLQCLYPIFKTFDEEYDKTYIQIMRKKFGLEKSVSDDKVLVDSFLQTMEKTGADFTNSFRGLSRADLPEDGDWSRFTESLVQHLLAQSCSLEEYIKANKPRMDPRQLQMFVMLLQMNPELAGQLGAGQRAINDEIKRLDRVKELEKMKPETKMADDKQLWTVWVDKYIDRLKLEIQGVTSISEINSQRKKSMNLTNPRFILRNYIAQNAIEAAEKGDYTEVRKVLRLLENPYSDSVDFSDILDVSSGTSTSVVQPGPSDAECSLSAYEGNPPLGRLIYGSHDPRK